MRAVASSRVGVFAMTDFSTLDPETRAFALVGQFLKRWSGMEQRIDETISAAMKLDETMRYILCANLQLRDKLQILRTLVHSSSFPQNEKDAADRELVDILNYPYRNMIAHQAFEADSNGDGVVFLAVKARGKLIRQPEVWNSKRFEDEGAKIAQFTATLNGILEGFAKPEVKFGFLDWMTPGLWSGVPMQRTMSPALIDLLSRHPPETPGSNPPASNPKKSSETPEEPQE
jgi:hypothetical protein